MKYPEPWFTEQVLTRIHRTDTCWLWTGSRRGKGYGQAYPPGGLRTGATRYAHRIVYEQLVGPIPDGMQLDHVRERGCLHKHCVRPDHLEPVTPRQNTLRHFRQADRCAEGHPFTPENTAWTRNRHGNQNRKCRTCARRRETQRSPRRR